MESFMDCADSAQGGLHKVRSSFQPLHRRLRFADGRMALMGCPHRNKFSCLTYADRGRRSLSGPGEFAFQ
jgi:hypothetical protein